MSVVVACALGVAFSLALSFLTRNMGTAIRRDISTFFFRLVEEDQYQKSLDRFQRLTEGANSFLGSGLWVVNESGEIVAAAPARDQNSVDWSWKELPRPTKEGEVAFHFPPLSIHATTAVVKLSRPGHYLIIEPPSESPLQALTRIRTVAFVIILVLSGLATLLLTLGYFRLKSRQAKAVLAQFAEGNFRARFKIDRLDEAGQLMLQFNRMADEIESLVHKLQESEETRRNLIQELGHDLRTPLTSLCGAIETLSNHGDKLDSKAREELKDVVKLERSYFTQLIEDLFFIAEVTEPNHAKQNSEEVNLKDLIQEEANVIIRRYPQLEVLLPRTDLPLLFKGRVFTLRRMLRNAFENAARFAKTRIEITVEQTRSNIEIRVTDDGPGLSDAEIKQFGTRRSKRIESAVGRSSPSLSLGLGSVIMHAIATAHSGTVHIVNRMTSSGEILGAQLIFRLPAQPTIT
jgi:signal transduction histidine kinase